MLTSRCNPQLPRLTAFKWAKSLRSQALTQILSANRPCAGLLAENLNGLKILRRNESTSGKQTDDKQDLLDGSEPQLFGHRFIPMTRRTLCRKLLEDSNLYATSEHLKFQDFIVGIDTAISRGFHGTLGDIKVSQFHSTP